MKNFKNKLLMLMVVSSITTSIMPLTFFDDGSIVHRGGPGEGREHFWNRDHHNSNDDRDYNDQQDRAQTRKKPLQKNQLKIILPVKHHKQDVHEKLMINNSN